MPSKPLKPCNYPGCGRLTNNSYCEQHKNRNDKSRGTSASRGYNYEWQKYRVAYLRDHPLCAECERHGRVTAATVVDHIEPHKGNYELFWASSNHQPLCKQCHDIKTAKEDGGFGNPARGHRG